MKSVSEVTFLYQAFQTAFTSTLQHKDNVFLHSVCICVSEVCRIYNELPKTSQKYWCVPLKVHYATFLRAVNKQKDALCNY